MSGRRRACETCGHPYTPANPDHGFGRVMIGECTECDACNARLEAEMDAERDAPETVTIGGITLGPETLKAVRAGMRQRPQGKAW